MMALAVCDDAIAVRLADEGVPLCAIARAIQVPSEAVREQLTQACDDGRLLSLPHNDWPPGFPRDQRALQLSRLTVSDRDSLMLEIKRLFELTSTEVELFLTLLQSSVIRREFATSNLVSVHIHHLRRRLSAHGLRITTLWGHGYQLSDADRRKAMDLILARVEGK
jgi:hypothetical protein